MYPIEESINMVSGFIAVCDSLSQTLVKKTVLNFNYDNRAVASILLTDPKWRNLNTDVSRLFNNTPAVASYIDRWETLVKSITSAGCILESAVDEMKVLFHDMLGCLKDINQCTEVTGSGGEMKLFISHNSEDREYCQTLVYFLISLGFKQEDIVCTSIPNCGPLVGDDIYVWLRSQFYENLHVIYMLSENYFKSVSSVCEMGAAWVTQKSYTSFILPEFSMGKVQGPIDKNKMGVDMNLDDSGLRAQLKQFAKNICVTVSDSQIDLASDQFIKAVKNPNNAFTWGTF